MGRKQNREVVLSFRITDAEDQRIKRAALRDQRTVSQWVRIILQLACERSEGK